MHPSNTRQKRLKNVKRDHQKRPILTKRVLRTYNETYIRAFTLHAPNQYMSKETYRYEKRPVKETFKRDTCEKRPIHI